MLNISYYSKGSDFAPKIAIVLPGKLDTKDYPHMKSHVDFLARLGFYALSFDPPGTWESGSDISLYNTTNYLAAIDELIQALGNRPTLLVGHSYGGSIAMLAAGRNDLVTGFIAIMSQARPIECDLARVVHGTISSRRDLPCDPRSYKEFALPLNFYDDAKSYDIASTLRACAKPKLFIAGIHDKVIPTRLVQEAWQASIEPKEIVEIDSDHDYRCDQRKIQLVEEAMQEFFKIV